MASAGTGVSAGTWVALLRAVNVGRANRISMANLRGALEALGYRDVRTYLQSGNAVFSAAAQLAGDIEAAIGDELREQCGVDVAVVVVSAEELASIARANPLLSEPGVDEGSLHVVVLDGPGDAERFAELALPAQAGERAVLVGRAIYLALPMGMGRTRLSGAYFERAMGRTGTARNWRTVRALLAMADDAPSSEAAAATVRQQPADHGSK